MSHPCKHQSINATIHSKSAWPRPPGNFLSHGARVSWAHYKTHSSPRKGCVECRGHLDSGLGVQRAMSWVWNGSKMDRNGSISKFLRFSGSLFFFCFGKWLVEVIVGTKEAAGSCCTYCSTCSRHVAKRVRWEAVDRKDYWGRWRLIARRHIFQDNPGWLQKHLRGNPVFFHLADHGTNPPSDIRGKTPRGSKFTGFCLEV